jgi:hypothetical protein
MIICLIWFVATGVLLQPGLDLLHTGECTGLIVLAATRAAHADGTDGLAAHLQQHASGAPGWPPPAAAAGAGTCAQETEAPISAEQRIVLNFMIIILTL